MNQQIKEKRAKLRELSAQVTPLVKAGDYPNVNAVIVDKFYKNEVHTEFKSFDAWKASGKQVKKGEKAFIVWGRPKAVQDEEKGKEPDAEAENFFPVGFIFSNAQVMERR